MSVNSSSPSNSSLHSALQCQDSTATVSIDTALHITRASLLLPLSVLVLYLGYQRWRRQRSFATTSHADIAIYHLAAMELIWSLGSVFFFCSFSPDLRESMTAMEWLFSFYYIGENLLHVLTCVERYLAVVHPITYLRLSKTLGVRIRNVSIGCVWVLCVVWSSVMYVYGDAVANPSLFCLLGFSLAVVSFCSLSVLRVLIRPGPGDGGGDRERVDQSKQRAFHTIVAIMGVLWLWFVAVIVNISLDTSHLLSRGVLCVVDALIMWFNLPISLVLPLLYLHRAGVPPCCYRSG